jgi:hypothetical protein
MFRHRDAIIRGPLSTKELTQEANIVIMSLLITPVKAT